MKNEAPNEAPKVVLFGATGNTGKYVCKHALEAGHSVIAYVRNPDKLNTLMTSLQVDDALVSSNLKIVKGNLTDATSIATVIEQACLSNSDAIVNVAGKPQRAPVKPPLIPVVIKTICDTMRKLKLGCTLLNQAGEMTVTNPRTTPYFLTRCMIRCFGPLLGIRGMLEDNEDVAHYLYNECSDIDWIMTRPGLLKDVDSKQTPTKVMGIVKAGPSVTAHRDLAQWTVS
eukprot:CAMPEP_0118637320 /NCGR_PEP_ID=MMETSP0785-20121206/3089_1 /TAXON_ID=91992 /ORGANISM="Bolidomonas pacifica, Strain CCMP 1866" /LENGTH=227 /DNA_ID=CAMNT_0006528497 /DNA_START=1160 /DNA_END=1840 /DNA_ORIENTATION=+